MRLLTTLSQTFAFHICQIEFHFRAGSSWTNLSDPSCVISIKFLKVEKISDRGEILEALHRGAAQEGTAVVTPHIAIPEQ